MSQHEVIVSNIGTVYNGTNGFEATRQYNTYKGLSCQPFGKPSGESVTWLKDGEIHKEHNKQFNELTVDEMKKEGFGIKDITLEQLESDKLFVDFQCKGGAK